MAYAQDVEEHGVVVGKGLASGRRLLRHNAGVEDIAELVGSLVLLLSLSAFNSFLSWIPFSFC